MKHSTTNYIIDAETLRPTQAAEGSRNHELNLGSELIRLLLHWCILLWGYLPAAQQTASRNERDSLLSRRQVLKTQSFAIFALPHKTFWLLHRFSLLIKNHPLVAGGLALIMS